MRPYRGISSPPDCSIGGADVITNTAATLYNRYTEEGAEKYARTLLRDVSWQAARQYRFSREGAEGGWTADIFIPFSVDAEGKSYLPPGEFIPGEGFTLQKRDYIVKGECPYEHGREHPITELLGGYPDVVTITGVETCDYGPPATAHWEVSGN